MADTIGRTFGRLTVLAEVSSQVNYSAGRKRTRRRYECECICGRRKTVTRDSLLGGKVRSCGCTNKSVPFKKTHGLHSHPLRSVWNSMKQRCCNENNKAYRLYGAKGITVCGLWLDSFSAFYAWSIKNGWEKGLRLDRIDNGLGYSPDNCRYVNAEVNYHNKDITGPRNKSGFTGVWFDPARGKFESYINGRAVAAGNKRIHLGRFNTAEEAAIARDQFILKMNLPYHKLQVLEDTRG